MESDPDIFLSISFLLSLFLLACFASAEVAFASLAEERLLALRQKVSKRSQRTETLLSNTPALFLALKGGMVVAYIVLLTSCTLLCLDLAAALNLRPLWVLLCAVIVVAILLFTIHEVLAARFALDKSVRVAEMLSLPLLIYTRGVSPVVNLLLLLLKFISRRFELDGNGLDHHKILAMVENGNDDELEDDERAMIHSIIEFGDTEVHEIMVPRTDMVCVDETTDLRALTKLIREKGHSRIPLYSEDVDNILGIIHVKDLLPYSTDTRTRESHLTDLARPAYFVPESKKLDLLLKEFQKEKYHMAIVLDEYGGTAGLVTLEDVIEEIVGDIQDEYDKEPPLVRKVEENVYLVDAKIDLHELNETLMFTLPTEGEYESLGGFMLSLTGYVPEEKEVVTYENYSFSVEKIARNRIIEVKLTVNVTAAGVQEHTKLE
ncbi:MAG: hemolysin family protein [bacterium]